MFHIPIHFPFINLTGIVKYDSLAMFMPFFVNLPEEDPIFVLLDMEVQEVDAFKDLVFGVVLVLDPAHLILVEVLTNGMLDLIGGGFYISDLEFMH